MTRKAIAWGPVVLWALALFLLSEPWFALPGFQRLLDESTYYSDKLGHFVLYLALGGLLARGRWASGIEVRHTVLLAVGWAYAALDEWHQSFVPGRTPDIADWLADVAGVAVGYMIITLARGLGRSHKNSLRRSGARP